MSHLEHAVPQSSLDELRRLQQKLEDARRKGEESQEFEVSVAGEAAREKWYGKLADAETELKEFYQEIDGQTKQSQ